MGKNEFFRKMIHISFGLGALALRYLTPLQALSLAATAFLFNCFLLHRVTSGRVFRKGEEQKGYSPGILLYPLSIIILIIVFYWRMEIVAAAWGFLAFGDGAATIAGKLIKGKKLPWNKKKSVIGFISFMIIGAAASSFLYWWNQMEEAVASILFMKTIVLPICITSCLCAVIETIPTNIDDNFSVPLIAGVILYILQAFLL